MHNVTAPSIMLLPADYKFLQQDIDRLCTWISSNLLKLIPSNATM